jgi:Tol biopolymer transport system component
MLYDRTTKAARSLTEGFDSNVGSPVWSPDSKSLYFEAEEKGNTPLWRVSLKGEQRRVFGKNTSTHVNISRNGRMLVFIHQSAVRPVEIYRVDPDGMNPIQITQANDALFARLEIPAA